MRQRTKQIMTWNVGMAFKLWKEVIQFKLSNEYFCKLKLIWMIHSFIICKKKNVLNSVCQSFNRTKKLKIVLQQYIRSPSFSTVLFTCKLIEFLEIFYPFLPKLHSDFITRQEPELLLKQFKVVLGFSFSLIDKHPL